MNFCVVESMIVSGRRHDLVGREDVFGQKVPAFALAAPLFFF